jgi:predicted DNA binding protein
MSIFEIEFKIRHECRLGGISVRHPQSRIKTWKIGGREVIEILPKRGGDCTSAIQEISQLDGVIDSFEDENCGYVIAEVNPCQVERMVEACVTEFGIVPIEPVIFTGGWQYHRIVVFDHDDINKILTHFEESCFIPWMLRKVPFRGFSESQMTVTTESLFSDLTEKQTNALLVAYSHGYYKMPRDADLQTIADKTGSSRTTFQEHLKKAENKVMNALVPHVHTWHHFVGSRGTHPAIRESYPYEEIR